MEYRFIHEILKEKGLKDLNLSILRSDDQLYSTLLLQPQGTIVTSGQYIKSESEEVLNKCINFVELALSNNVDLAITPEYCFPWILIKKIIDDELFPDYEKIWILGCQSITKEELSDLIKQTKDSVIWICEDEIFKDKNKFLDPICYIFKVDDNSGQSKRVITIQFKTKPMGDRHHLERDNLILGKRRYVISNNTCSSIQLITFICSDLLDYRIADFPATLHLNLPYLFVHLQLNDDSRHQDISYYRNYFLNPKETESKVEVISLNWAEGTTFANLKIDFSGSAFYLKSNELNKEDSAIANNHNMGLYYAYWDNTRSNIYYMNTKEGVYLFRTTKVSLRNIAPTAGRRTGPDMLGIYSYDLASKKWTTATADDGVKNLCREFSYKVPILSNGDLNPMDKERLVTLSCGFGFSRIRDNKRKWYWVDELDLLRVDDREIIKRITFVQDQHAEARTHRNAVYALFNRLLNIILKNSSVFPECIKNLYNNSELKYVYNTGNSECNCNLFPVIRSPDTSPATVVYLGVVPEVYAQEIFVNISTQMIDYQVRRLVVWYDGGEDGKTHSKYLEDKPTIGDNIIPGNQIIREN